MKINQAEELAGITKKNIRFYEEQGLLRPERNPENGYREYSLGDVEQLKKIKLLRKLDVPCEQIRQVASGGQSLPDCLRDQRGKLEKRRGDLLRMQELCDQIAQTDAAFDALDTTEWLERMEELEKGGVRFMDAGKTDVKQRRWGAMLSAAVSVAVMIAVICMILWGNREDPLPAGVLIFLLLIPAGVIAGVVLALYQRMKELKGGELDEAGKY
ncbi:MAG: MerR family transcriptional regulator [Oscillospiraceae bacterium]|nr:MerR family transcriptional regulator [Oscillospiraceae bacterium]